MRGEWIDHLSRNVSASRNRRDAAKLVLASALTLVTVGAMPRESEAAQADEVGAQRRAPRRCRRNGARCKRQMRQYCWDWYPSYYGPCSNQLTRCCNYAARCKNGRAIDCLRRSGW